MKVQYRETYHHKEANDLDEKYIHFYSNMLNQDEQSLEDYLSVLLVKHLQSCRTEVSLMTQQLLNRFIADKMLQNNWLTGEVEIFSLLAIATMNNAIEKIHLSVLILRYIIKKYSNGSVPELEGVTLAYSRLGSCFFTNSNFRKAELYQKRALKSNERYIELGGEDDPLTKALINNNIGLALLGQRKYKESLFYIRRAYVVRHRILNRADLDCMATTSNLCFILSKMRGKEKSFIIMFNSYLEVAEENGIEASQEFISLLRVKIVMEMRGEDYSEALLTVIKAIALLKKMGDQGVGALNFFISIRNGLEKILSLKNNGFQPEQMKEVHDDIIHFIG